MNEFEKKLIEVLNIVRQQSKIKTVEIHFEAISGIIKPNIKLEYYE